MNIEVKEKDDWFEMADKLGLASVNCHPDF